MWIAACTRSLLTLNHVQDCLLYVWSALLNYKMTAGRGYRWSGILFIPWRCPFQGVRLDCWQCWCTGDNERSLIIWSYKHRGEFQPAKERVNYPEVASKKSQRRTRTRALIQDGKLIAKTPTRLFKWSNPQFSQCPVRNIQASEWECHERWQVCVAKKGWPQRHTSSSGAFISFPAAPCALHITGSMCAFEW